MRSPRRSSAACETFARFGATLELWRRECGEEFGAIEPLLVPTNDLASGWPGRLPSRPPRRVVDLGNGMYRAVCDEDLSEPVDLTREQLVLHRIDEQRLRAALCEALGLSTSRDELRPLPGLLRIGQWRFSQSSGCPVWLALAPTGLLLAEQLREAGITSGPQIALLFTRGAFTAEAERAVPTERFMVAALDEVLEIADGAWVESAGWDLALGAFAQAAKISVAAGFRAQRKKARVARTGQTPAKLKDELKDWYRSARDHLRDTGQLLPAPEVKLVAKGCGVDPATASRWLNGEYRERDSELKVLWASTSEEHFIRSFRS